MVYCVHGIWGGFAKSCNLKKVMYTYVCMAFLLL
nr:MAG TPA: hypothetical protein [Caudoviricetes sp.]